MISKEFLRSSDISGTQALDIYEMAEIVIIDEDKNLKFGAFQVAMTYFQGFNNG